MLAADPIVSASIYCGGRLDAVIHGAVAPALERLRREDPAASWGVWWVRYARGGEHLKVRLHGPAEQRDAAERVLAEAAEALFAALPPAEPDEVRPGRAGAPAIDPEDEAEGDRPDRSLLRTRYRRSPVSLGPLFLDDDVYVARICTCLARGAELALTARPGPDGAVPAAARQRTLLKAVIAGLGGAGYTEEERRDYLAYHRDWLLRFVAADRAQEERLLAGFERQVGAASAAVAQLRGVTASEWAAGGARPGDSPEAGVRNAVAELCSHLAPVRHDPARLGDPFARDATFPAVFKSLHGTANQLGMGLSGEAYLYHLLLAVAGEAPLAAAEA